MVHKANKHQGLRDEQSGEGCEAMSVKQQIAEKMPGTAAFLEDLASVLGDDAVWPQVEKGLAGEPTFFARENGVQAGTRDTRAVVAVRWDEYHVAYTTPADWIIEARAVAEKKGISIKPANPGTPGDDEREAKELRDMIAALKGRAK